MTQTAVSITVWMGYPQQRAPSCTPPQIHPAATGAAGPFFDVHAPVAPASDLWSDHWIACGLCAGEAPNKEQTVQRRNARKNGAS